MYDYDWLCQISSVYHGVPVDFLAMAPWTYQVVMTFFSQVRLRGIGSGFLEGSDGTEAWIMGIWGCLPPMPTPSPGKYGLIVGLLRDLLPVPTRPICRCNWMSAARTTPIMCVAQHLFWGRRHISTNGEWIGGLSWWVGVLGIPPWSKNPFHI